MSKVIRLETVPMDHSIIKFHEPLLVPFEILDEGTTWEYYYSKLKKIDVLATGTNLEEFHNCLQSDMRLTWERVCHKPESKLTPKDKEIRRQFRKLAEEINIG